MKDLKDPDKISKDAGGKSQAKRLAETYDAETRNTYGLSKPEYDQWETKNMAKIIKSEEKKKNTVDNQPSTSNSIKSKVTKTWAITKNKLWRGR